MKGKNAYCKMFQSFVYGSSNDINCAPGTFNARVCSTYLKIRSIYICGNERRQERCGGRVNRIRKRGRMAHGKWVINVMVSLSCSRKDENEVERNKTQPKNNNLFNDIMVAS